VRARRRVNNNNSNSKDEGPVGLVPAVEKYKKIVKEVLSCIVSVCLLSYPYWVIQLVSSHEFLLGTWFSQLHFARYSRSTVRAP